MSAHDPLCDTGWGYPDFLVSRGIEREDCWLCELLDKAEQRGFDRASAIAYAAAEVTAGVFATTLESTAAKIRSDAVSDLKQIGHEVAREMDGGHYGIYKEYRKEVWVRFRDAMLLGGGNGGA